ncbi:NlpC/P60 family protein [Methylotenera sp.]|uniref:NlpC/P60 family protein n=1 Tax=Methylotenera sp. TaxID=2051956 RepID=UPI00248978AE|nr:NlpC/P60 family protein [Methylotenera sp.]MDI1362506.1 NlpC/P60 family protein [Methylotenera sp.]
MIISHEATEAWEKYVIAEYPNEACAYVVDGSIYPVKNHSETPTLTFSVDVIDRLMAHKLGKVEAFLHSHPYKIEESNFAWNPAWASAEDMKTWIADNIPWGISSTEGEGVSTIFWYDDSMEAMSPLEGREFISGLHDCYSVVRDYYRSVLGIHIPNFSRGYGWWDRGEELYLEGFEKAGFIEIPMEEATINDAVMMSLGTGVVVHAAVIVGENQILQHNIKRLSGYDSLAKWGRQIVKAVRYVGVKND